MDQDIIIYQTAGLPKLMVKTDGETVWLTIEQMCQLFGRDKSVIGKHVRNVFKEGELPLDGFRQILPKTSLAEHPADVSNVQNLHKTTSEGGRPATYYNLDVVISVGYRVKSIQGTRFRQWATRVLREMLMRRVHEIDRIGKVERRVDKMEGDIRQIKEGMGYLVKQLSAPSATPELAVPRIGFGVSEEAPTHKPYGFQC